MNEVPVKRDYGKEFEEEVKIFLEETLQLSDVKGGPNFHIAADQEANQIDACGRYKDILFVFECKAAGRKVKKDMRKEILASATKANIAFENYKNIPEYKHCKIFRFIFITKKIEVPKVQVELCKKNRMYYEEQNLLQYYTELHEKIDQYATFNFLADFGIYPPERERLVVTALKTKMGGYTTYSFFAQPRDLLKFAYVARRRVGKEDFYQRMLDTSRIKNIKTFLNSGGMFPTNIIISLKKGDRNYKEMGPKGVGTLAIKGSYDACWIIDGQHRLYSFAKSTSNEPVSCIAFDGLDIEKERGFFLEINREQRPIQPDLIWDLEGLSDRNSPRGVISNIVHILNKIESGPFFYKIYIPLYGPKVSQTVNMAAFCNGISNASLTKEIAPNFVGMKNPLTAGKPWTVTKRVADVLSKYFSLLREDLEKVQQDFVFGNAGVPIMLYLLEPIVAHIKRVPSANDLRSYTRIISRFFKENYSSEGDLKKLKAETNSEGARKNVARGIGLQIRREIKDTVFWPDMEQDEFVDSIKVMERRIANLIATQLSSVMTGWEKKRVPQAIYEKAKQRMEQDGTTFSDNLNLGEEADIILRKDNWEECFRRTFISERNAFSNEDELRLAFRYLSKIRNPSSHAKPVLPSKEDLIQCDIYLKRFNKVVPEMVSEFSDVAE